MSQGSRKIRRTRLSAVAEVLVASVPAVVAFTLGGAASWALWPLVALACGTFIVVAVACLRTGRPVRLPLFAAVPAAAAGFVALQLVPMPLGLLRLISPDAAELREFVLVPLGLSGAGPITLDAPATWRELGKHLSYLALFVAAAHLARTRVGAQRIVSGIALGGVAIAVVAFAHRLAGMSALFGAHAFDGPAGPIITPFVNPNHLSAFMALAASCALAVTLMEKDRARSMLWAIGFLTSGAVVVLSLSRGGVLFFAMSQVLAGMLIWRRRTRALAHDKLNAPSGGVALLLWRAAQLKHLGAAIGAVVVSLALGGFIGLEQVGRELETTDSLAEVRQGGKFALWPAMWSAASRFLVAGMGRGAWELGFTRYQDFAHRVTFTHPENLGLQLLAEHGLLVTLLLGGTAAVLLWRTLRGAETTEGDVVIGAALVGAALHDLFDFSLELPATAAVAAVMLGVLLRRRDDAPAQDERGMYLSLSGMRAAAAGSAVFVLALFALLLGRSTPEQAEAELARAIRDQVPAEKLVKLARPLIETHPADYLLHSMIASALAAPGGDPAQSLAFANRAFFLWPLDANAHRASASALLRAGRRGQAMIEYRLAYEAGDHQVLAEATRAAKGLDELRAISPPAPRSIASVVVTLWNSKRREEAAALADWWREELKPSADAAELWILSASHRAELGKLEEALLLAREAVRLDPLSWRASYVLAETLARKGALPEAITVLRSALRHDLSQIETTLLLARLLHQTGERDEAHGALERLSPLLATAADRARVRSAEAELLRAEGRTAKAIDGFLVAARLDPNSSGYRFAAAQTYEQAERVDAALEQVREGVRIEGRTRPEIQAWIDRLEAKQKEIDALRKAEGVLGAGAMDEEVP